MCDCAEEVQRRQGGKAKGQEHNAAPAPAEQPPSFLGRLLAFIFKGGLYVGSVAFLVGLLGYLYKNIRPKEPRNEIRPKEPRNEIRPLKKACDPFPETKKRPPPKPVKPCTCD